MITPDTDTARERQMLRRIGMYFAIGMVALIIADFSSHQLATKQRANEEQIRSELALLTGRTLLTRVSSDVSTLAQISQTTLSSSQSLAHKQARLSSHFHALAEHAQIYEQIRFINKDGKETVRINYHDGKAQHVPAAELQDKLLRHYVQAGLALLPGQVHITSIDPNLEHGIIVKPLQPVLRMVSPVFSSSGERLGMVVLNYNAGPFLEYLQKVYSVSPAMLAIPSRDGCWQLSVGSNQWRFLAGASSSPCVQGQLGAGTGLRQQIDTRQGLITTGALNPADLGIRAAGADNTPVVELISQIHSSQWHYSFARSLRETPETFMALILSLLIGAFGLAALQRRLAAERQRAERIEQRYSELFERAPDGILVADRSGIITGVNDAAAFLLGRTQDDMLDSPVAEILPDYEAGHIKRSLARQRGGAQDVGEWRLLHADGTEIPVEASANILPDGSWQAFVRDIRPRKEAEVAMRQAEAVFENTLEPIVICDADMQLVRANKAYMLRFGRSDIRRHNHVCNSDTCLRTFEDIIMPALDMDDHWQGELHNEDGEGRSVPVWANISAVRNDRRQILSYVLLLTDISELKATEDQLRQQAHTDPLTGLANRAAFDIVAQQALERAVITGEPTAMLMLDLDRFKQVNDTLGHAAGDALLQTVSQRLLSVVRNVDTVVRLGGDEFAIILPAIGAPEHAANIARKLVEALSRPVPLESADVLTSTSVGIALYPGDGEDLNTLLLAADEALYRAKDAGRNTFRFHAPHQQNNPLMHQKH